MKINLPSANFQPTIKINEVIQHIISTIEHNYNEKRHKENTDLIKILNNIIKLSKVYLNHHRILSDLRFKEVLDRESADFLANTYETEIAPFFTNECDFERSLDLFFGNKILPKCIYNQCTASFKTLDCNDKRMLDCELEKIVNIFLLNEDLLYYKNIRKESNKVVLETDNFVIQVTLCGSLDDLQWMVTKASCLKFDENAPLFVFNRFGSIKELTDFIIFHESCERTDSIINRLKEVSNKGKIPIKSKGDYKNFEITVLDKYTLYGKIVDSFDRYKIVVNDKNLYVKKNVIDIFEKLIKEQLIVEFSKTKIKYTRNSYNKMNSLSDTIDFSFEKGIIYKNIEIKGIALLDDEYFKILQHTEFYQHFRTKIQMNCTFNFSETLFGNKNIMFRNKNNFFVLRMEGIMVDAIECRIFVGTFIDLNKYVFEEVNLVIDKNEICIFKFLEEGKTKKYLFPLIDFQDFIVKNSNLLVNLYNFKCYEILLKNNNILFSVFDHNLFVFSKISFENNKYECNLKIKEISENKIDQTQNIEESKSSDEEIPSLFINSKKDDHKKKLCNDKNSIYYPTKIYNNDEYKKQILGIHQFEELSFNLENLDQVKTLIDFVFLKNMICRNFETKESEFKKISFGHIDFFLSYSLIDYKIDFQTDNKYMQMNFKNYAEEEPFKFIRLLLCLGDLFRHKIIPQRIMNNSLIIQTNEVVAENISLTVLNQESFIVDNFNVIFTPCNSKKFFDLVQSIYIKNKYIKIKKFLEKTCKIIECNENLYISTPNNNYFEEKNCAFNGQDSNMIIDWSFVAENENIKLCVSIQKQKPLIKILRNSFFTNDCVESCFNEMLLIEKNFLKYFGYLVRGDANKINELIAHNK